MLGNPWGEEGVVSTGETVSLGSENFLRRLIQARLVLY